MYIFWSSQINGVRYICGNNQFKSRRAYKVLIGSSQVLMEFTNGCGTILAKIKENSSSG
jgi:hypothetical protein